MIIIIICIYKYFDFFYIFDYIYIDILKKILGNIMKNKSLLMGVFIIVVVLVFGYSVVFV